jgi:hypothetical protein
VFQQGRQTPSSGGANLTSPGRRATQGSEYATFFDDAAFVERVVCLTARRFQLSPEKPRADAASRGEGSTLRRENCRAVTDRSGPGFVESNSLLEKDPSDASCDCGCGSQSPRRGSPRTESLTSLLSAFSESRLPWTLSDPSGAGHGKRTSPASPMDSTGEYLPQQGWRRGVRKSLGHANIGTPRTA